MISELSPISTVTFSIRCGKKIRNRVFTTIKCSYLKDNKIEFTYFESENSMITELIQVIISEDPDVLTGFEIDNRSWGYVAKRFNFLNQNSNKKFESEISRIKNTFISFYHVDPWIARASSQFQVQGRIVLNLWRIYREEISLRSYSLSDLCKYYFQKNVPHIRPQSLILLLNSDFASFLKHCILILNSVCDLTTNTPFLIKSIEFSRLFGIDLFSTLTRGSQYRVESILITAAHSEGYLLRTPTEADVRSMRAAQGLPLTMEPISNYYRDPIVILDFQSLYPSMIVAHNFCYSTVIGTVSEDLVVSCGANSEISPKIFNWESYAKLSERPIFKAPGEIFFVKKEQKIGLIPRLLYEILATRVSIKNAMKACDPVKRSII